MRRDLYNYILRVLKINCRDKYINDNQITLTDVTATTKDALQTWARKSEAIAPQ